MGIFRNRASSRRQVYYPQAQAQARPSAPPVTPVARPTATPAPVDKVAPPAAQEAQSTPAPTNLLQGFSNLFGSNPLKKVQDAVQTGGDLLKANRGVQLTPEERAQVQQASGVMNRLAGADGMWNRGDLTNNVKQLERSGDLTKAVHQEIGKRWGQELSHRGLLGRALVNGHMNRNYGKYEQQGMNQARGMAKDQLSQGQNQAGVKDSAGHDATKTTEEGLKKSGEPISRAEMEKFQKTMDMLQEKSKAQGLPEVSFPNGVPAKFLKDIAEGKNPQQALKDAGAVLKMKNGQTIDLGKLNMGGDKSQAKPEDAKKQEPPAVQEAAKTSAQQAADQAVKQTADGVAETQQEKPAPEPTGDAAAGQENGQASETESAGASNEAASATDESSEAGESEAGLDESGESEAAEPEAEAAEPEPEPEPEAAAEPEPATE